MSFEIILPFLRPIAPYLVDPEVSEIMVNPGGAVFIERHGRLEAMDNAHVDERNLQVAVRNIARLLGNDISEERLLKTVCATSPRLKISYPRAVGTPYIFSAEPIEERFDRAPRSRTAGTPI